MQSHLNHTKDKSLLIKDANITTNTSGIGAQSNSSVNTYFANTEQIKFERESLERIHTFSLKEPNDDFEHSEDGTSDNLQAYKKNVSVEGAMGEIQIVAEHGVRN